MLSHRVSRIFWNRHFFDYPISVEPQQLKAMGFKLTMVAGFSYLKSMFHKAAGRQSGELLHQPFRPASCIRCSSRGYTEKLGAATLPDPADWGAQRVKGLSIMGVLKNAFQKLLPKKRSNAEVETSLIEEFWYPEVRSRPAGGDRRVNCEAAGVKVLTDARVVEVRQTDGAVSSVVYEDSRATAPSFPATSSSPRCRSRTWSTPSTRPAPIPRPLIPKPPSRYDRGGQRPAVPRFRDRGPAGQAPEAQEHHQHPTPSAIRRSCRTAGSTCRTRATRSAVCRSSTTGARYLVKDVDDTVWIGLEYFCEEGDSFWNMSEEDVTKFAISELTRMRVINGPGRGHRLPS